MAIANIILTNVGQSVIVGAGDQSWPGSTALLTAAIAAIDGNAATTTGLAPNSLGLVLRIPSTPAVSSAVTINNATLQVYGKSNAPFAYPVGVLESEYSGSGFGASYAYRAIDFGIDLPKENFEGSHDITLYVDGLYDGDSYYTAQVDYVVLVVDYTPTTSAVARSRRPSRRDTAMNNTSPQRRYLAISSTQTAWVLSAGRSLTAPENTANAQVSRISANGLRGLLLTMVAEGADNVDVDFRIWAHNSSRGSGETQTTEHLLRPMAYGTFKTSAAVGVAGGIISAAERVADTVSLTLTAADDATLKGPGKLLQTTLAEGTCDVYSPFNDTPALVALATLFRAENIVIEFKVPTAATKANLAYDALPV